MRAFLGFLTVGLFAQATVGQVQISSVEVSPVNQEDNHVVGFAHELGEGTLVGIVPQADVVLTDKHGLQSSQISERPVQRRLGVVKTFVRIIRAIKNAIMTFVITVKITDGNEVTVEATSGTDSKGRTTVQILLEDIFLNADKTDICDNCEIDVIEKVCPAEGCAPNINGQVTGDPHMVGLLGQKVDWAGVDNAWYCLLSDGPDFHVNVRLSAPMPEEFPDRQLISAVSVLSNDGCSSVVVEVKNPYSTDTDGCPQSSSVPCLADGGLRILIDGEESTVLQASATNVRLPGSSPVVLSAANLPAECRPFGGDRIWATLFAEIMTDHRRLRTNSVSFEDWILQPDTLAAPTWCAQFLEAGLAGILSTASSHATFRVETPAAELRINVGVNYQDLETAPDGTVLVPELEFWQTDVVFDILELSANATGLMGDTSRFVLDDEGVPVTSGLGALHGTVESYRVAGSLARDFDKLDG